MWTSRNENEHPCGHANQHPACLVLQSWLLLNFSAPWRPVIGVSPLFQPSCFGRQRCLIKEERKRGLKKDDEPNKKAKPMLCPQPPKNARHECMDASWFGPQLTTPTERLPLSICLVVSAALGSRFRTHQIPTSHTIPVSNNQSHSLLLSHTRRHWT